MTSPRLKIRYGTSPKGPGMMSQLTTGREHRVEALAETAAKLGCSTDRGPAWLGPRTGGRVSQLVEEDQLTCSPTGMPRTLNRVSVPLIDSLLTVDLALARWLKDPTSQKPTAHMPK